MNALCPYWTADDFDAVWRTLYGEARGESIEGQVAVLYCIINRALLAKTRPSRIFGDGSLRAVCVAPWQFSCMNPGTVHDATMALFPGSPVTARSVATTLGVLLGDLAAPAVPWWTIRVTHYHVATDAYPHGWVPNPEPADWIQPRPLGVIGHHAFYSEDAVP